MAYLGGTSLSNFTRNKNYLLTGKEEPQTGGRDDLEPSFDLSGDTRYPGLSFREVRAPRVPSAFSRRAPTLGRGAQTTPTTTQTQAPNLPQSAAAPSQTQPAPGMRVRPGPAPTLPSYQRTGSLAERLFSPLTTGAQRGQESLTGAADFFRQEAGPSRSYESTGAQETLRQAYQTGAQPAMDAARGFVGARYAGPQGLEQGTVAGLQKLTEDLQTRQRALGTGGGLQTLIGQSVAGLTPGEALFEARRRLPEARVQARDLGFHEVNPLIARLIKERREADEFAKQRTGEEADIAAKSRGYLTGERGGISSAVEALMAERAKQQAGAEGAFADILAADPEGRLAALRGAAPFLREGTMEAPGARTGADVVGRFNTQTMQDKAAADALFKKIMADPRYASIAGRDPLELGVTGRGKAGYDIGGEDVRGVVDDPAVRRLLYERQRELEAAFDPARGQARAFSRTPATGGEYSQIRPLYYGEEGGFQSPDPLGYLGFDPGVRPSRENTSTAVQKEQFNRINDLLGELDRISDAGDPFRAAQIFADADKYLANEEAALEAQKGKLSEANEAWRRDVKKLRKSYRKAAREKEYGKIGGIVGGVLGLGIGQGDPAIGSFGGQLGQGIGESFA